MHPGPVYVCIYLCIIYIEYIYDSCQRKSQIAMFNVKHQMQTFQNTASLVQRKMKVLGNSLEAKVHLKCNSSQFDFLSDNLELIKRVLIVSELSVSNSKKNDLDIVVEKTKNKKCQRCWMHYSRKDFSKSDKNICMRCEQQLKI